MSLISQAEEALKLHPGLRRCKILVLPSRVSSIPTVAGTDPPMMDIVKVHTVPFITSGPQDLAKQVELHICNAQARFGPSTVIGLYKYGCRRVGEGMIQYELALGFGRLATWKPPAQSETPTEQESTDE